MLASDEERNVKRPLRLNPDSDSKFKPAMSQVGSSSRCRGRDKPLSSINISHEEFSSGSNGRQLPRVTQKRLWLDAQLPDLLLKLSCHLCGIATRMQGKDAADVNGQFSGTKPARLFALEFSKALEGDRQYRDLRLRCKQADARTEGVQQAVLGAVAFGKDQDGVSAIERLAGVGKAAAGIRSNAAVGRH